MADRFESDIGRQVTVGRHYYTIERVIAEGGYGVVFLIRDGHGKRLALKRIYVDDEMKLRDCRTEIEILSSISGYKNIIRFMDSSVTRSGDVWEVCIVTEFYPGSLVKQLAERRSLSESEILKIYCDMCEALSILHHSQIPTIHRDVKLENILIDQSHNYVLCDFGSAIKSTAYACHSNGSVEQIRRLEEDFNRHTTKSHRAPEIVDFYVRKTISTKLDIWSLGVTLYRMCYGSLPFGESALGCQSGLLSLPESPTYSKQLRALIMYHFEVEPEKRPDIFQVAHVGFRLAGKSPPMKNIDNSPVAGMSELITRMEIKTNQTNQPPQVREPRVSAARTDWVETTTIQPRQRPKPGGKAHATSNPDISNTAMSSANSIDQQTYELLGISGGPAAAMTRSLDSGRPASSLDGDSGNPFGDDFSKMNPFQLQHGASAQASVVSSTASTGMTQRRLYPSLEEETPTSYRQSYNNPPRYTHTENRTDHFTSSSRNPLVNGFEDDFSSFNIANKEPATHHLTDPREGSSVDAFGSRPFV